jgi:hypothetical protein
MAETVETTETTAGAEGAESPVGTAAAEPKPFAKTEKDFAALQLALDNERRNHKTAKDKLESIERSTLSEAELKWQAKVDDATHTADIKLKHIAARSALVTAGLVGKPDKLAAILDLDAVDVGDDGNITGLDKQIADLKKDYPALFAAPGPAGPGQLNIGGRPGPKPRAKGYADQIASQIFTS